MKKIIGILLLMLSLMMLGNDSKAQRADTLTLSISEINKLLDLVDTIKGHNNYHIWVQKGFNENTKIINVFINNRLADNMFKDAGINICNFYNRKQGVVFLYKLSDCKIDIPSKLLVGDYQPSDYGNKSPFESENGFQQTVLAEKIKGNIYYYRLSLLNEDEILKKMKGFSEVYWDN